MCYKTITNRIRLMAQDMPDCLLKYTFQGVMEAVWLMFLSLSLTIVIFFMETDFIDGNMCVT